ncbi:MAG: PA14 domain-containing protein [Prolixibacteraceae bacterium]|jgi:hypothetical protein
MKRNILRLKGTLLLFSFLSFFGSGFIAHGQTVLINPASDGGFENGTTFTANGWTVVDDGTNDWIVGTGTNYAGSRSAYVSSNGTTNLYDNTNNQTSHFYRDVTIPSGENNLELSFYLKGVGEAGFDRLLIYTAPISVTPVAGVPVQWTTTFTGATLVYTQSTTISSYSLQTIKLPSSLGGTTFRLIFTWQNDNNTGTDPPAAIDNIRLTSQPGTSYLSSGTYTFTVPAGVTQLTVEAWGGGGKGGQRGGPDGAAGGGGGGAYSRSVLSVIPGQVYDVFVGDGSNTTAAGGDSRFRLQPSGQDLVRAKGGISVANNSTSGGSGGLANDGVGNDARNNGGGGGNVTSGNGGGGGSSGGTGSDGNYTSNTNTSIGGSITGGGSGGNGSTTNDVAGSPGNSPGGGGGGAKRSNGTIAGGTGADGQVIISWTTCTTPTIFSVSGGGSLCSGGSGVNIILSGSETGVTYELYNNSTATGNVLSGTGSALTFSNVTTTGTYTIVGTRTTGGCTANMTGSATVVVYATPSAPTIGTVTQPDCNSSSGSIVLQGLPSGLWTLTRVQDGTIIHGSGIITTISGLNPGIYSYTVTQNQQGTGLTGEYFSNRTLTGPATLVRTDATVGFDWINGSPDPSISSDNFSVRWSGKVEALYSETYTFTTNSDDGIRLWVNGQKLVDNWTDHAATNNSGTIDLVAGHTYDITLEFYENGGQAVAKLYWSSASQISQIIPQEQLYSRDICSSSASTPVTINVQPSNPAAPDIVAPVSPVSICEGSSINLNATSAGNTIYWYTSPTGGTSIGSSASGANFQVAPTANTTYYAEARSVSGCVSPTRTATALISIEPSPTGSISGSTTICTGGSTVLSIDVTGTGPWNGTLSNGQSFSGSSSPINVTVNPTSATTYTITTLYDANCSGSSFSGSATVSIAPVISYIATSDATICKGETTTLAVSFDEKTVLFNGTNGNISISNSSNINLSVVQNRTVALWFKANDVNTRQVIYEEGAGVNGFSIFLEGGYINVHAWENNSTWGEVRTAVITGNWYHVAFVFDSGASDGVYFKGYLNGVNFGGNANSDATNGMSAHSGDIHIGMSDGIRFPDNSTHSNNYYNGYVDEFKLWNRSLSAAELQSERWNVNEGTQSGPNLIVYYNFNNDSGTTVTDETGANNGTRTSSVSYDQNTPFTPSVVWSPGGMTALSVDVSPATTTTYTFTLTNPINGCGTSGNIMVTVNSPLPPTLSSNSPICSGNNAIYIISGTVGDVVTYSGVTSGNVTIGVGGTANVSVSGVSADVTLNLTNVNDGTCSLPLSGISETVTVTPIPSPPFAGNNGPVCVGSTLNLTASSISGATYSWTGPNGFTSGQQNPSISNVTLAATGTYSVTAIVNGCTSSAGTTNAVVEASSVGGSLSGGISPICQGSSTGTLILTGYNGTIIRWERQVNSGGWSSVGNGGNASYSEVPYSAGTWEYRAIVQNGSCGEAPSGTISIEVDATTVGGGIYTGNTPICTGASTGTMNLTGYTGSVVRWEKRVNGGVWSNITNTVDSYSEIPSSSGTWEYRALVQSGACTSVYSSVFTVVVNPTLTITLGSNPVVCQQQTSASLSYSATTGNPAGWILNFDDASNPGHIDDQNGALAVAPGTISVNIPYAALTGTYHAVLTVITYYPACTSADYPVTVTVSALPIAGISGNNGPVCSGSDASFSLSGTSNATVTYNVNGGTNSTVVLSGGTALVTIYGVTTSQTLNLVSVDNGSCSQNLSGSSTVTINALPNPAIVGSSVVCVGETASVYYVTNVSGHTYSWAVSGGTISSGSGTNSITVNWGAAGSGTVDVTETIPATSCSESALQKTVTINALPTPSFSVSPAASECQNDDVVYTTQSGQSNYVWTISGILDSDYSITAGGTGTTNSTVTIKWLTTGSKTVTVNYSNANGCSGSTAATSTVTVDPLPGIGSFN